MPVSVLYYKEISSDSELSEAATIRKFRIVQTEGSRQVSREVNHYNLQMLIAVGVKVNNDRAVQFRKWANAEKPHMGLPSWENYPDGKIQKYDVSIAKNYLSQPELEALSPIVSLYARKSKSCNSKAQFSKKTTGERSV